MSDLIKRQDAIDRAIEGADDWDGGCNPNREEYIRKAIESIPSADRPSEVIYGNEHNCIMTIFGECSYAETGCGDCAVVEKVRKALSADRPKGEWIKTSDDWTDGSCGARYYPYHCSECGYETYSDELTDFCPSCGADMRGADDEVR